MSLPPQNFNYPPAQMIPTDVVQNLPERGTLCCCTAKGWSQFIGFYEITGLLSTAALSFYLKKNLLFSCDGEDLSFNESVMCGAIGLSYSLLMFTMSIVLLIGAKYENPGCLQAWIMYKSISLVLYVVMSISRAEVSKDGEELTYNVTLFILNTMISIFFIVVVFIFKQELSRDNGYLNPPAPYSVFSI